MNSLNNLSFKWKLISGFFLPLLLLVIISLTVNNSINQLLYTQKEVTHTHEAIELGDEITNSLINMETGLRGYVISGKREFLEPYDLGKEQFIQLIAHGKKLVSDYPEQVGRLNKVESIKAEWMNKHVEVAIDLRRQANSGRIEPEKVSAFIEKAIGKQYMDSMRRILDEYVAEKKKLVIEQAKKDKATADRTLSMTLFGTLIALGLGALASWLIIRNITSTIGGEPSYAIEVANRIASNQLDQEVEVENDSDASLLSSMKVMRDNLLERAAKDKALMDETSRIKLALDVCDTNVMMADNNFDIVYMNHSVQTMMSNAEPDLKQDLPNFNARTLMDENIDIFHKNPAHQRSMLESLTDVYRGEITVGGRTFGLIATPIFNDSRERLGTVVEWDDKTERLAKEREEQDLANENARIKMALDVCDTNVMMADPDYNIIYMNKAVQKMMLNAEADLKKDLPNIDVRNLIGNNIDTFHKNPAHQRGMLGKLTDVYRANIKVGGRTFGLIATPIFNDAKERLGTVVEWDDKTVRLAEEQEKERIAAESLRIKQALDNVTANVMLADADRNIIYANDAVVQTLRNAQDDLRKDLPNFNVDTMVGANIDQFHKNPAHQMQILDRLTETTRTKIVVGGRHMALIVNPVIDKDGKRLGTVVEWNDQTNEVTIQNELDGIIAAANDGNLSERISLDGKTGFFADLSSGLNTLLNKTSDFVNDVGSVFEAMAEGDLTASISTEYRGEFETIKSNANNSMAKLNEVLLKIQRASNTVRTSSTEVAQGSDDLSRRTESQASSLEETASSMEEITATVKQTSENATEANSLASEAKEKASAGGEVVQDAVNAMSEILDSSNKINDIIGVIDEIAFQTNLLALNAAVEAARAGEQGRGFAVVAGEVRTLSQRSAAAAKEIKDLIRDSVNKVESGSKLVNESGQTLADIVSAVDKVAVMIEDVNNASIEQNSGIGQINQAITQMDEMTQQNAALVEETSAASRSMSEEAFSMNNMISFFRLSGGSMLGAGVQATSSVPETAAPSSVDEPIMSYQPSSPEPASDFSEPSSSQSSAAAFSSDDEWEDF